MQLPNWWETLMREEGLVNCISREHLQIRSEEGRPVLVNVSQVGTYVNGEQVTTKKVLAQEDLISVVNRLDNRTVVVFRFRALDLATNKALVFEAPRTYTG